MLSSSSAVSHQQIQRNLQQQIEEQGRQLRMMLSQQQITAKALLSHRNGTRSEGDGGNHLKR